MTGSDLKNIRVRNGKYNVIVRKGGKQYSKTFSRLPAAKKWRDEMQDKLSRGEIVYAESETLGELMGEYLIRIVKRKRSATTYKSNHDSINVLDRLFGHLRLSQLNEDKFFYIWQVLSDRDISVATAKNYKKSLKGALEYGNAEYRYNLNMVEFATAWKRALNTEKFNVSQMRHLELTDEMYTAIKKHVGRHKQGSPSLGKYIILLALETGMRRAEMYALDIGLVRGGIYYLAKEKSDHVKEGYEVGRKVLLSVRAQAVIRLVAHINRVWGVSEPDRVFSSYKSVESFGRAANELIKRKFGQGAHLWLHGCRHEFATSILESGVSTELTIKLTGHQSARSLKNYNQVKTERLVDLLPTKKRS